MKTEVNERGACADVVLHCIFMHIRFPDKTFFKVWFGSMICFISTDGTRSVTVVNY